MPTAKLTQSCPKIKTILTDLQHGVRASRICHMFLICLQKRKESRVSMIKSETIKFISRYFLKFSLNLKRISINVIATNYNSVNESGRSLL